MTSFRTSFFETPTLVRGKNLRNPVIQFMMYDNSLAVLQLT